MGREFHGRDRKDLGVAVMRRLVLILAILACTVPGFAQTQQEDTPTRNGMLLTPIGVKRCDSATSSSGTDGDLTIPCTDSSGNLRTTATLTGSKTNDNAAPSTDLIPVVGAIASSAAQSYTTGRLVLPRVNLFGHLGVFFTDATTGSGLTVATDQTEDAAEANGVTGPAIMSVRRDTAVTSSSASGDYSTVNTDANGLLWVRTYDPCSALPKTTDPISITTDTVIISALASKKNYICALVIVAGAAEITAITEGTGSVCGTSEAALLGSTTDANGTSFAANGGLVIGDGLGAVINGKTTNVDTCLNVSGSNRVSGLVTYVQAP